MHSPITAHLIVILMVLTVKVCARCNNERDFECLEGYSRKFPLAATSKCIPREYFCDGNEHCRDGSDEKFCDGYKARLNGGCPNSWLECSTGRCVPPYWCADETGCWDKLEDDSEESFCVYSKKQGNVLRNAYQTALQKEVSLISKRTRLISWFLRRRKMEATNARWSSQLHRIATAFYLSNRHFFESEKIIAEEISYEIEIKLLSRLTGKKIFRRNELATYIHALLVLCIDPHNFHDHDLVAELRGRVEASNQTNPFELLVLCNAGDKMRSDDAEKAIVSFHSKRRAFWTENQAMALQSLSCIASKGEDLVEADTLQGLVLELIKRQFQNGTVDSMRTTAQVIQALSASNSSNITDFNFEAALKVILSSQKADGSFGSLLDSYYILPVLSGTGLFNVSSDHCKTVISTEMDALHSYQSMKGDKITVQYSIWIGEDVDLRNTLTLKMPVNSSLYDVIEMASKLDQKRKVQYNVITGKPYVSSVADIQDDMAMNLYWSIFQRPSKSDENLTFIQESPVDIIIRPNQEFILWYKETEM